MPVTARGVHVNSRMSDAERLRTLNEEYIQAFLTSDVAWYEAHLADDFVCIESDATVLDRAAFLRATAGPCDLGEYRLVDVDVRRYGDVALVRATGEWVAKNGSPGVSRYIDVYVRSGQEWRVVSAQITRPS